MVSMSKMPPSRLTISISYSNALNMKVIFCRYGRCRRRLDAVIGENVIFDFIFFLTIVLMKKSEKILKNTSHEGCPVRIFSGFLEPYFMVKKIFQKFKDFFTSVRGQVLPPYFGGKTVLGRCILRNFF